MLKRPSSRRKSTSEGVQLNLVPILDTMVTLIAFILFSAAFFSVVHIESPFPTVDPEAQAQVKDDPKKEKPLQLTLSIRENEAELWSPFEKMAPVKIPHVAPGQPDIKQIHEKLIGIKNQFPAETKIVLVPFAAANYDTLIAVMDAIRLLDKTDPPMFAKNAQTGNDEPLKTLFPEIIFGNLLGTGPQAEGS